MSVQELLAQVAVQHEALHAKCERALEEVQFLRSRLADSAPENLGVDTEGLDLAIQCRGSDRGDLAIRCRGLEDKEAPRWHHRLLHEPAHSALNENGERRTSESSGGLPAAQEWEVAQDRDPRITLTKSDPGTMMQMASTKTLTKNRTGALLSFFHNPLVECFLVLLVLSNVVVMWIETNRRAAKLPQPVWEAVINKVYLAVYVCEFALRVLAYRMDIFLDRWTMLDAAVVVIDMLVLGLEIVSGDGHGVLGGFNASIFRLLRIFRLVRVFKVLRFVIEIQLLFHGFFGAMKAVFFAAVVLQIVVLFWAFIFVEVIQPRVVEMSASGAFDHCSRCQSAYDSMWNAHLMIYQQVIASDSWGLITVDVMREHPETAIVFLGALMTLQFAVLNLIFTVIVDAAARARKEDEQQRLAEKQHEYEKQKKKLLGLCSSLDQDMDGTLSLSELTEGWITNPTFADTMASLDLTFEDMATLFMIMDEDRSGDVSYTEFVNNIYRMKEQDIRTMLMLVRVHAMDIRYKLKEDVTTMLQGLSESVKNTHHIEVMIQQVEQQLVSHGSIVSAVKDQGTADIQKVEQDVKEMLNLQAQILLAIQRHAPLSSNRSEDQGSWCQEPTKRLPHLVMPDAMRSMPQSIH